MSATAYWVGRFLQLSGLITTLYALPVGLFAEESKRMGYELGLLALGVLAFGLGRWIENRGRS
jgi:hypothetical protein